MHNMYVKSHLAMVDTSFNLISYLISEFFHLKLGGSRCLVLSMHPPPGPAVMEEGRSNRLPL